ncbi:hypothetical protein GGH13_003316 [Coemansia sp. S155-1]|nr:hypothetical protein GGH13_003316 [Coemansia sp. S155-1]
MNRKRSAPSAEPSTKKRRPCTTSDSFAADSSIESVSSRTTRSRSRPSIQNTSQHTRNCSEQPLALLLPAAEASLDPASNSSHPASPGATESYASLYSAKEAISDVVSRPTLNNIVVNMPRAVAQSFVPEYLPTPSPVLVTEQITPTPTQGHSSPLLSLQPLSSYATTARHKPKKPAMAFKYAIYSYGFKLDSDGRHRIPDENGVVWTVLQHDKFIRDEPELLNDIIRTAPPRKN